jgi:hypothetical protein
VKIKLKLVKMMFPAAKLFQPQRRCLTGHTVRIAPAVAVIEIMDDDEGVGRVKSRRCFFFDLVAKPKQFDSGLVCLQERREVTLRECSEHVIGCLVCDLG